LAYLEHTAATPALPGSGGNSSFSILPSAFPGEWGNPSSAYKYGSMLKGVIEKARAQVAEMIKA